MMCSTFSTSTAYCITDKQFRSVCTTTLAMLRCTKTSPGARPMISLAGTRLSAQPIHKRRGDCWSNLRLECSRADLAERVAQEPAKSHPELPDRGA